MTATRGPQWNYRDGETQEGLYVNNDYRVVHAKIVHIICGFRHPSKIRGLTS